MAGHVNEFFTKKELIELEQNEKCEVANVNLACAMVMMKNQYSAAGAFASAVDT